MWVKTGVGFRGVCGGGDCTVGEGGMKEISIVQKEGE